MFSSIHIQNYKSVRDLAFTAKRVNVFIGEPNTGKSNILEALGFFSAGVLANFAEIVRFKSTSDLYFDQRVANDITVQIGEWRLILKFDGGTFRGSFLQGEVGRGNVVLAHHGMQGYGAPTVPVRYYRFKPLLAFPNTQPGLLNPPFGDNLVAVFYTDETLRQKVGAIFKSQGFRLQLKPTESELLIAKDVNDELYSYPWGSVSETLRRIAFFMAVLETNQNATLLLDEPEANTFPFYTKYLAERIALDESNQFFITTHNPYLLGSIVSKAPAKDTNVFVTYMERFETKVKLITGDRLGQIMDLGSSVFFNLDKLVAA